MAITIADIDAAIRANGRFGRRILFFFLVVGAVHGRQIELEKFFAVKASDFDETLFIVAEDEGFVALDLS